MTSDVMLYISIHKLINYFICNIQVANVTNLNKYAGFICKVRKKSNIKMNTFPIFHLKNTCTPKCININAVFVELMYVGKRSEGHTTPIPC